ncbi:hypothetical protein KLP40_15850 [Hymenobacter sp. NST-14]|uniref:hypothetical protein n=1 Tax=Hymenobacter piscis TaxID=2839984 RepID=UPI001C01F79E|nr:hypothetical protein [Hymenobacter piscis]MBT9394645.1 hypothetical protein [Hymenobacter piscis]
MRTSVIRPLLRRLGRALAYRLFQGALALAYALRSVGALRLPLHFQHGADEAAAPGRGRPRVRPRAGLATRPAL